MSRLLSVWLQLTFGEADARSAELAGRLSLLVWGGAPVGILFANGPEWVVSAGRGHHFRP